MFKIIDFSFDRSRTAMLVFAFILLSGSLSYLSIPKESDPDVAIPFIFIHMSHEGISPEDAERLLVRPMEKELQTIEGVKNISSSASEGFASVLLEFDAGFDSKKAIQDVRARVDVAKSELPVSADEPTVNEINVALFPVLTVNLYGQLPELGLLKIARELKDKIEALPGVLEVDMGGNRDEVMEVLIDPTVMETYAINYDELFSLISRNNLLVAAGALDTGAGRMVLKVSGVIEKLEDIMQLPVKVVDNQVITFDDIAVVRRTFKDPQGFARIDGKPGIALEIKKRIGANIIETVAAVRSVVTLQQKQWPKTVNVGFMQDNSEDIRDVISDLQNNVLTAVVLVMIVVIAALGLRSALLVGLAIPGSFLAGILILNLANYTLNIITLFSLILVVGMLVDGAIVVIELADRKMCEGLGRKEAYAFAAKRMSWPVIASTATTLAVFLPLVFWPGMMGEFMKFLPITVIICLSASLFMALIFIPVIGGMVAKKNPDPKAQATLLASESGDLGSIKGLTGVYLKLLGLLIKRPVVTLIFALIFLVGSYTGYAKYGKGVEFFPDLEPKFSMIQIHARGDLSVQEKDGIVREVEQRILDMSEVRVLYARTFNQGDGVNRGADVIGVIQMEFIDWKERRKAQFILDDIRLRTRDVAGVILEIRKEENGPGDGKPIQLQLSSVNPDLLSSNTQIIRDLIDKLGGFADVEDNRALPGIEWRLEVDRELAARYGADISLLGNAVQMMTNGINIASYRPDDTDEELDIRVRFPQGSRSLDQLQQIRVPTAGGMVSVSNFMTLVPAQKTGTLERVDSKRVITIQADVDSGLLVDDKITELRAALNEVEFDPSVKIDFKGEDAEQRDTMDFLAKAFASAIFLMAVILVTQFNSFYQMFLVLSAIVFSTAGVLLGLLITSQPFGIVMVGIGIIALAGIVVNNNIVLIDTFNSLRKTGMESAEAAMRTGAQRLRPVVLTAFTTVLGLMPMVLSMNIDILNRTVTFGAPSSQWWTQLSAAIAGGLTFATVLTLILTPCLLVLGENLFNRKKSSNTAKGFIPRSLLHINAE